MWIEEIKRELVGRMLAIWTGVNEDGSPLDLQPEQRELYLQKWRAETQEPVKEVQGEKPTTFRRVRKPVKRCNCGK